jgi:phosphonate transport system substrate-binding protein
MSGPRLSRRSFAALGCAALTSRLALAETARVFRLGLTPVFLDNDAAIIESLRGALSVAMGLQIELVQRRTYQEVTGLLLERSVDAAWLCGYPYLQHADALALVAVPLWNDAPLYRSYLITGREDPAKDLEDLRGGTHAFSDPDSNSGFLVTASDLIALGERPDAFFARTIFTYGHRNVVRAVASGLARSGSVDGYVWEALQLLEPDLVRGTQVIARSEWLGFPPVCARRDRLEDETIITFRVALLAMSATPEGREALHALHLDGFTTGDPALFEGIAIRMRLLAGTQ